MSDATISRAAMSGLNLPLTEEVAIDYARLLGWWTFPVGPDCRVPWTGNKAEKGHGYKDAAGDAAAIRALWRGRPANIALATGPISGVWVLDVDCKDGAVGFASLDALVTRFGPLPETWRSRTPSGGAHLFFRHPDRPLRNRVNLHVDEPDGSRTKYAALDVRAAGGSVALPPSRKPSGPYTWEIDPAEGVPLADAPDWLLDVVDPPPPPRKPPQPVMITSLDRMARYVQAAVDAECGDLAGMNRGGRNLRLFQAAANLGELVGAGLLPQSAAEAALEAAASDCGVWNDDGAHACRASIASGLRKGMANPREVRA